MVFCKVFFFCVFFLLVLSDILWCVLLFEIECYKLNVFCIIFFIDVFDMFVIWICVCCVILWCWLMNCILGVLLCGFIFFSCC